MKSPLPYPSLICLFNQLLQSSLREREREREKRALILRFVEEEESSGESKIERGLILPRRAFQGY